MTANAKRRSKPTGAMACYKSALDRTRSRATLGQLSHAIEEMRVAARIDYDGSAWWMYFYLDERHRRTRSRRDLRSAIRWLRRAVGDGDALAMYSLGMRLLEGDGVRKDIEAGVQLVSRAAAKGDADAAAEAGHALLHDLPRTPARVRLAIALLRKAAAWGSALGACALGWAYFTGTGVRCDLNRAVSWYRIAAKGGNSDAMWNLLLCYEEATGVPRSARQARAWLERAAKAGHPDAKDELRRQRRARS